MFKVSTQPSLNMLRVLEAEHRANLAEALTRPRRRTFAEVLASMPSVGVDTDFERVNTAIKAPRVYLIDTQVISEASEKDRVNPGVTGFTSAARARGDRQQAALLDTCLDGVLDHHRNPIFAFDGDAAQVWGRVRVAHSGHELDKQIAAIALVNAPTVVTRNAADLVGTGVDLLHPFVGA